MIAFMGEARPPLGSGQPGEEFYQIRDVVIE
jgi:hypothetical protein